MLKFLNFYEEHDYLKSYFEKEQRGRGKIQRMRVERCHSDVFSETVPSPLSTFQVGDS